MTNTVSTSAPGLRYDTSYGERKKLKIGRDWYSILKDLVKKYGNDQELGQQIRLLLNNKI